MNSYRRSLVVLLGAMLFLSACAGRVGPSGPIGPAGPAGPEGPVGPPGEEASASQHYVGSDECGQCHETQYAAFTLSGHPHILTRIEAGQPPDFPYDSITGGVNDPPEGYAWEDISYVVGGFGWQARFVDDRGYLITGDEGATTQYNFANEFVDRPAGWVAFHAGEQVPFDCGRCHTTGYRTEGHQDDLEGIAGTWAFEGVQCEACHGPGSRHADDPYGVLMRVDRSSQLCGKCHSLDDPAQIAAVDGFEQNQQHYSDLYSSKHFALSCITCHDPHASALYTDEAVNPAGGIVQQCQACHWQNVERKVEDHLRVDCVDCHMPAMALSAQGDPEHFRADLHSHKFAINTDPAAPQFSEDGTQVMPYLTLPYVCGQCHNGTFVNALDPAAMAEAAQGYHERPIPASSAEPEATATAVP